jgi:hypothetical protein
MLLEKENKPEMLVTCDILIDTIKLLLVPITIVYISVAIKLNVQGNI